MAMEAQNTMPDEPVAPEPEPAPTPLDEANAAIAKLKAELEAVKAAPVTPGPGNSRGGLVRDTGAGSEQLQGRPQHVPATQGCW